MNEGVQNQIEAVQSIGWEYDWLLPRMVDLHEILISEQPDAVTSGNY